MSANNEDTVRIDEFLHFYRLCKSKDSSYWKFALGEGLDNAPKLRHSWGTLVSGASFNLFYLYTSDSLSGMMLILIFSFLQLPFVPV